MKKALLIITALMLGCSTPPENETERLTVRVPDVVGMSLTEAEDCLYEADLAEVTHFQYNSDIDENIVYQTEPAAGRIVNKGSKITLFISQGPEPTPESTPEPTPEAEIEILDKYVIPDQVIGMNVNDAVDLLEEMGIIVRTSNKDISVFSQEQLDSLQFGIVVETDPPAGTEFTQTDDNYVIIYYY